MVELRGSSAVSGGLDRFQQLDDDDAVDDNEDDDDAVDDGAVFHIISLVRWIEDDEAKIIENRNRGDQLSVNTNQDEDGQ